jgi:hypothetical protein
MNTNLDEQTGRDLEQEMQTEIYPGTEIMVDDRNHRFVKASGRDHSVLVPQPSDAANDPLVWSSNQFFCLVALTLLELEPCLEILRHLLRYVGVLRARFGSDCPGK